MTTEATGRWRFRVLKRFMRQTTLVLQIEERVHGIRHDQDPGSPYIDTFPFDYTQWRDARPEEVMVTPKNLGLV